MHFSSELGIVEWHKYKSNVQLPQQVISSHPPLDGTQHPWPSANRIHFHWSPERAMTGLLKVPQRGTERVYCTYHNSIYTWHGHLPPHAHPSPYSLPSASLSIIPVHSFMPLDSISQLLWGKQIFFFLSHGRATPSVFLSSWCCHSLTLKAGFSYSLFISVLVWIHPEADSDIQGFCVIVYLEGIPT